MQLLLNWLPDPVGLQLVGWEVDPVQAIIALNLRSQHTTLPCPLCQAPANRLHSQYERTLPDLPWGDWRVKLGLYRLPKIISEKSGHSLSKYALFAPHFGKDFWQML